MRLNTLAFATLVFLVVAVCSGGNNEVSVPVPVAPVASNVSLAPNPNPTVPMAAIFKVTSDVPTTLTLNFSDGSRSWTAQPSSDLATAHEVPVIGMRAGVSHTISATLTASDGGSIETPSITFDVPELPELFPAPNVTVHDPERMQPGVTIFNVNGRWDENGSTPNFAPAIMVDDEGEIIWYYLPDDHKVHDIRRLENGRFIYEVWPGTAGMIEIDLLGNITRRWHFTGTAKNPAEGSIPVETDSFHHDFIVMPNGNFLLLSSEVRVVEGWYTSETDSDAPRAAANVVGDVVVEFTPEGEIVNEWKLFDIIDPMRIGYNSLREDFWARHYDGVVDGAVHDWTHGNAIIYEEDDHAFVMSLPYQDAVVKVSMETGELVWIIGNHDNWKEPQASKLLTPVGDVGWAYKHHAISHTAHGTYLLFDNGVARSSPFDERMPLADSYSRAVEYDVDKAAMEVRQPWVYGAEQERFYGRYLGDVDWHEDSKTILINVGAQETNAEGTNVPPGEAQRWARLIEVTHTMPAKKVWEMRLQQDDSGWAIYRADRLAAVYPTP